MPDGWGYIETCNCGTCIAFRGYEYDVYAVVDQINAGEAAYGRSPADTVLPDIKILKAIRERVGDAAARKATPLFSGCINYFPDALLAVAELSKIGNEQHNPGSPLHWDRSKSGDEKDALARHLVDAGTLDTDGVRHSAKVAWRALANLQKELEAERERD